METLLAQLNSVPGVLGSLVCGADGQVLAQAFPAAFDAATLGAAAQAVADGAGGLAAATGGVRLLELRCASARVVARPVAGGSLVFLCAPGMNVPALTISTAVVAPKLEKLVSSRAAGARPAGAEPPARSGGQLLALVQRIDAAIQRKRLDPFKVRGTIAIKAGFGLGFIDADTPDDPKKLATLRAAASAVLGEPV